MGCGEAACANRRSLGICRVILANTSDALGSAKIQRAPADFRAGVLGVTDPEKAATGSMRWQILQVRQERRHMLLAMTACARACAREEKERHVAVAPRELTIAYARAPSRSGRRLDLRTSPL